MTWAVVLVVFVVAAVARFPVVAIFKFVVGKLP